MLGAREAKHWETGQKERDTPTETNPSTAGRSGVEVCLTVTVVFISDKLGSCMCLPWPCYHLILQVSAYFKAPVAIKRIIINRKNRWSVYSVYSCQ